MTINRQKNTQEIPMQRTLTYTLPQNTPPQTITTFLKHHSYSTTLITALKKTPTGILKNQTHACVNELLHPGDTLQITIEETVDQESILPVESNLSILYEDEDILVINKPHNMPVHQSINNYHNTLANAVAYYFMKKDEAYVFRCINRLDRDTTGATILAKNALSAAILSEQVKNRAIHRTYMALVEGVTEEEGVVDLPIGRKEGSVIERQVDLVNGKRAVTHYRRLAVLQYEEKEVSLLALKLETGRTHQIRVHMSYLGHPLLGDFLYNEGCKSMERQALHSAMLSFSHPITGEMMKIEAPLPEDMKRVLVAGGIEIIEEPTYCI